MFGPALVTAALAFFQNVSAAILPNNGSVPAHLRNARLSSINWLQAVDDVSAAVFVTGPRAVPRVIQVDADPSFEGNFLEDAMAGGEVDIAVAKIVDAFEELGFGRIAFVDLAVRQREVRL